MPPPPPPTMHGGGDYWAGRSGRNGPIGEWDESDLTNSFNNSNLLLPGTGFFPGLIYGNGYFGIRFGIFTGYYNSLTQGEWETFIREGARQQDKENACALAINQGGPAGELAARAESCPQLPLPKELIFFSILSFLMIYYYQNREKFSNLNFLQKSNE